MVTNQHGAQNFTSCSNWKTVLKGAALLDEDTVSNVTFGLNALGAVENEFTCAGFCKKSIFYTFSEVDNGPPFQNCTIALSEFAEDYFPGWGFRFFLHAGSLLLALVATGFVTFGKKRDYERFENEKRFVKGHERSDHHHHHQHR